MLPDENTKKNMTSPLWCSEKNAYPKANREERAN